MHAPIVFQCLSLLTIMVQVQACSYMPDICGKVVCKIVQLDLRTWQRVFAHSNRKYTLGITVVTISGPDIGMYNYALHVHVENNIYCNIAYHAPLWYYQYS